ncbi:hypothetical protein AX16_010332 [Volvariella volvacea WC 439]|nr:hypothetical protein AX16_010332 [Volvariella volvacea WC 439]
MSQQQTINAADLDISQLAEVRRQLEEEINHLTNSFTQLKQAQSKFKACIDSVVEVKPQNKDKSILVPLTNSLYVPGKLSNPDWVIVDVGTGYYVKKTREQATKYYNAKVDYIRKNLEALEGTITQKRENLGALLTIMQSKIQAETQKS